MKLYIVATPIGNLEDITLRALKTLKEVDYILCEDTRHSLKLLNHYQIQKPLISYHQHSKLNKVDYIIKLLQENKKLALISDAGTPGISDPGNELIQKILEKLPEVEVIAIPGPSVVTALASISGINTNRFLFLGFLPIKKHRNQFLEKIVLSDLPVIFYESPYKLLKTLKEIEKLMPEAKVVVAKELTKMFEKVYRGDIKEVIKEIENDGVKGEYAVLIEK
jgi:16S rRNA (cytidine1402-2'-O)-methyltransferase